MGAVRSVVDFKVSLSPASLFPFQVGGASHTTAPLVQLDRTLGYGSGGCRFESCGAYHSKGGRGGTVLKRF